MTVPRGNNPGKGGGRKSLFKISRSESQRYGDLLLSTLETSSDKRGRFRPRVLLQMMLAHLRRRREQGHRHSRRLRPSRIAFWLEEPSPWCKHLHHISPYFTQLPQQHFWIESRENHPHQQHRQQLQQQQQRSQQQQQQHIHQTKLPHTKLDSLQEAGRAAAQIPPSDLKRVCCGYKCPTQCHLTLSHLDPKQVEHTGESVV